MEFKPAWQTTGQLIQKSKRFNFYKLNVSSTSRMQKMSREPYSHRPFKYSNMKRLLSLPTGYLNISLLRALKEKRSRAIVIEREAVCSVQCQEGTDSVCMQFVDRRQELAAGTEVYVWYHLGGFVCDACAAVDNEEAFARNVEERVEAMRQNIAKSREQRKQRHELAQKEAAARAAADQETPDSATAPLTIY